MSQIRYSDVNIAPERGGPTGHVPARLDAGPNIPHTREHGRCSIRYACGCTQARSSGLQPQQAQDTAAALAEVLSEQIATKHDINELRSELRQLEQRLVIKLGGMIAAAVALVAVLVRLL
jgi:hypothetical protein